jgi:hypothetical protein
VLIRRSLAIRTRFHLHFTPIPASWLNLVEGWFATLTEKGLAAYAVDIGTPQEREIYVG